MYIINNNTTIGIPYTDFLLIKNHLFITVLQFDKISHVHLNHTYITRMII